MLEALCRVGDTVKTPVPLLTLFALDAFQSGGRFIKQCEGWHLTRRCEKRFPIGIVNTAKQNAAANRGVGEFG